MDGVYWFCFSNGILWTTYLHVMYSSFVDDVSLSYSSMTACSQRRSKLYGCACARQLLSFFTFNVLAAPLKIMAFISPFASNLSLRSNWMEMLLKVFGERERMIFFFTFFTIFSIFVIRKPIIILVVIKVTAVAIDGFYRRCSYWNIVLHKEGKK